VADSPNWQKRCANSDDVESVAPEAIWTSAKPAFGWGFILCLTCALTIKAEDWPQWRGPNRDGVWAESDVLESFPSNSLPVRWRSPVGFGYSSPVISQGMVFVTDVQLDTRPVQERVLCFDETIGKSLWTYTYKADYPNYARENLSPPCATPIVNSGNIYVIGSNGHVHCFEVRTGKVLWEQKLEKQLKSYRRVVGLYS
jgi:outer membrane protein assembly factor BamB